MLDTVIKISTASQVNVSVYVHGGSWRFSCQLPSAKSDPDVWLHSAGLTFACQFCNHSGFVALTNCFPLALQGNVPGEAEHYMGLAKETIEQLKSFAMDLRQQGQPIDNVVMT